MGLGVRPEPLARRRVAHELTRVRGDHARLVRMGDRVSG